MIWHSSKPKSPVTGDCYHDRNTNIAYIWQGIAWVGFTGEQTPVPPFLPPTDEQLEKHPSLKQAWDEFLVIKRLLGV